MRRRIDKSDDTLAFWGAPAVGHVLSPADRLTATAETNVVPRGSFLPIWATVEQKSHQPLLLLMDECVAASEPELRPGSLVHPIIGNKG